MAARKTKKRPARAPKRKPKKASARSARSDRQVPKPPVKAGSLSLADAYAEPLRAACRALLQNDIRPLEALAIGIREAGFTKQADAAEQTVQQIKELQEKRRQEFEQDRAIRSVGSALLTGSVRTIESEAVHMDERGRKSDAETLRAVALFLEHHEAVREVGSQLQKLKAEVQVYERQVEQLRRMHRFDELLDCLLRHHDRAGEHLKAGVDALRELGQVAAAPPKA